MVSLGLSGAALAGDTAKGQVVRIKVHGVGLEGNLSGDSPEAALSGGASAAWLHR